jgi:NitT/TauT family transport system ATP-binding protein
MTVDGSGIVVERLRHWFVQAGTGHRVLAIDGLDFQIAPREMVAIVGQTGCGKSTFLNLLIGLEPPTEGRISVDGRTPHGDFTHFRGRLAAVFQQDRLLPWRTALQNVQLGLELLGRPADEQRRVAIEWLERLGLERFAGAYPHELSGGMRQRVALARAFAIRPVLLLADEAFGHLDEVTAASLRATFLELARTEGSTAVFVTHQLEEAIEMGDRILVFGKPARLLADLRVTAFPLDGLPALRARIQAMLQKNEPDPELTTERTHR